MSKPMISLVVFVGGCCLHVVVYTVAIATYLQCEIITLQQIHQQLT